MILTPSKIHGAYVIAAKRFADRRGDFYRSFDSDLFDNNGLVTRFDYVATAGNHKAGTLRGMHFQKTPHGETKLVRVTRGRAYDVAVDLRPDSPTYLRWDGVELSYENQTQFYIPVGCGHGYLTLEDNTDVAYCIAGLYAPTAGAGVRYNDAAFGILWPGPARVMIDRDAQYPDYAPEPR